MVGLAAEQFVQDGREVVVRWKVTTLQRNVSVEESAGLTDVVDALEELGATPIVLVREEGGNHR